MKNQRPSFAGLFAALTSSALLFTAPMQAAEDKADAKFVSEAAQGGMAEVQLGKLAEKKAQSADVKEFGAMMVKDHSKAGDELKQVCSKNNLTCPTDLDPKHKAMLDKMEGLSGAEFDKAYVSAMVKDHEEDAAEFRKAANKASNPDVKAFAAKTLPVIETHLEHIKKIAKSEKAK
jgi:putative membrane protein